MKKTTKIVACLLAVLSMSFTACGTVEEVKKKVNIYTGNKATVWGADGAEKVFQTSDGFAENRKAAAINLTVAKGEKEASQIIISAESNLTYDFIVSDLSDGKGNKFEAEKVDVFHEKYIEVTTSYNNTPTGMYPDAIVPLENIKSVGENVVKEGENQGVYVRFDIPSDQTPGVYTGNFTLKLGDKTQSVPVVLNVLDLEVSEENHVKSINLVRWGYQLGEKNGSQELLQAYVDFLYDYRLCSYDIVHDESHSDEGIAYYTETAYQNMQNPKCSLVVIPFSQTTPSTYTTNNTKEKSFDAEITKKYLRAFAEKSIETGFNMFSKACGHINTIDEPDGQGFSDSLVKEVSERWKKCCLDVAAEIEADETIENKQLQQELVESLKVCYNVVTTGNVERYAPLGVEAFCPGFQAYDTEEGRDTYADQSEKWWYGCIYPRSPYPTYQIDDDMIAPRVMGWMQADYDIVGNLFWAFDYYKMSTGKLLEDYYDTATRFPLTNGDGFLMYPGSRYGIDGPVASLRLEAIRDGFEEYELLRELKMKYKETGESLGVDSFTADALFDSFSSLYNGTRVITDDSVDFQLARTAMFNLCLLNQSSAEVYLTEIVDKGASYDFVFFAKNGTVMKNAGEEITNVRHTASGSFYTATVNMDTEDNRLQLEVISGDETLYYTVALGGKVLTYTPDVLKSSDFDSTTGCLAQFVTEEYAETIPLGDRKLGTMELNVFGVYEDEFQLITMTGEYVKLLTPAVKKAMLNIRYFGDDVGREELSIIIAAKFKNSAILVDVGADTLGWADNFITLSFESTNWDRLGEIEYLSIQIGEKGEGRHFVYINELVVFYK